MKSLWQMLKAVAGMLLLVGGAAFWTGFFGTMLR